METHELAAAFDGAGARDPALSAKLSTAAGRVDHAYNLARAESEDFRIAETLQSQGHTTEIDHAMWERAKRAHMQFLMLVNLYVYGPMRKDDLIAKCETDITEALC